MLIEPKPKSYIVYLKEALIRVDAERPFYIFKGSPCKAVIAKIHDNGCFNMGAVLPHDWHIQSSDSFMSDDNKLKPQSHEGLKGILKKFLSP